MKAIDTIFSLLRLFKLVNWEMGTIVSISICERMRYFYIIMALAIFGCKTKGTPKRFERIYPEASGLFFNNTITESDSLNIMDYDYLYNGGGVGIGDFNMDGRPDIFFTANMTTCKLFLNKGGFQFEDITESAGVTTTAWCTGVSVVDINTDGKPDIHVSTGMDTDKRNSQNYFFINVSEPGGTVRFVDRAKEMGLNDSLYSIQAAWLDYDKDDDLDLFLINNALQDYPKNIPLGQRSDGSGQSTDKLYRNEGVVDGIPKFVDVSEEAGVQIEGWSLGVTISDFNHDAYPDIYVANDFLSNDILYINQRNGTFKNEISHYLRHQSHNSMGIDIADVNNDAQPDIVVLDMLPEDNLRQKTMFPDIGFNSFQRTLEKGYQPQYVRNMLQLNNGNRSFSEVGNFAGIAATDWSWSPLLADFDNDGLRDLYITNGYVKEITDLDFADTNNKSNIFGTAKSKREKLIEQLNNMKGVDKSNVYYKNLGKAKFADMTKEVALTTPSFSNGAAYVDLDSDGDLDLVVNNINTPALLFDNKTMEQTENTNYLKIQMPPDKQSLGSKIYVYSQGKTYFAEHYPQRGYLSSMESRLHFGVGSVDSIDSVRIIWPNSRETLLTDISSNQTLNLSPKDFATAKDPTAVPQRPVRLMERDSVSVIDLGHTEKQFKGFDRWPLHFRAYDKLGPAVAVGDINGDSLEDFFVSGAAGFSGRFFYQAASGLFFEKPDTGEFSTMMETNAAVFFDVDNDGDLDLYCGNGSSEHIAQKELWHDALYKNDGAGRFSLSANALPTVESITATVIPLDFDNDGDLDLFVGGRVRPDSYPQAPRSYILQNTGGKFKDATHRFAPELLNPGMVTDAFAEDLDRNGTMDLVLVGEYMPLQIYMNDEGKFTLDKTNNGLQRSNGWWNCLKGGDFDNDGDIDFIAGNWGLNNFFHASSTEPLSIYASDFDQNGSTEAIATHFVAGKEYIVHPRNTLMGLMPGLRHRIPDYASYGTKTVAEIFGEEALDQAFQLKAHTLSSCYIENLGNGKFRRNPLPEEAQWAPIFDLDIKDLNGDGNLDVIGVGNYFGTETLTGRYDAGNGLVLLGDGAGNFTSLLSTSSGFFNPKEARHIAQISIRDTTFFLVANQNSILEMYKNGSTKPSN